MTVRRRVAPLQLCRVHGVLFRSWKPESGCRVCRSQAEDAWMRDNDPAFFDRLDVSIQVLRDGFGRSNVGPPPAAASDRRGSIARNHIQTDRSIPDD